MTMKTMWRYIAFLALVSASGSAAAGNEIIKLTKASDIQDAMRVHTGMEPVTKKVMYCVQHKLAPPQKCFCLYPKEVNKLKDVYDKTLKAHPDWKDNAVNFSNAQGNYGYSVNFFALRLQFQQQCK